MRVNSAALGTAMLLAAVVVGCSVLESKEPAPMYRGTMSSGCAPHDAPSTELRLEADNGEGWVSFNLWPAEGVIPPSAVRFDANRPIAQGAYCTGPDICESAEWGEIVIVSGSSNSDVHGQWTLGLGDGRVHRGAFEAEWLAIQAFCG